jgi:hypothetical protein
VCSCTTQQSRFPTRCAAPAQSQKESGAKTSVVRIVFCHRAHNLSRLIVCKVISRQVVTASDDDRDPRIRIAAVNLLHVHTNITKARLSSDCAGALWQVIDNLVVSNVVGGRGDEVCVVPLLDDDKSTHQIVVTSVVVAVVANVTGNGAPPDPDRPEQLTLGALLGAPAMTNFSSPRSHCR